MVVPTANVLTGDRRDGPMKEIMQNSTISSFPDPAARLVRMGSNFESILCGLAPPVSEGGSLACIY